MRHYPAPISVPLSPYLPVPRGWRQLGYVTPSGVLPPPNAYVEANELKTVEAMNAAANADPQAKAFTTYLATDGGHKLWAQFAKQYRQHVGFVRGWLGTGLLDLAEGVAALKFSRAKRYYNRLRPYQIDPSITPIGPIPKDASYPSGHSTEANVAATVLSALWPQRSYEFQWWARQVELSRIAAGVHFPSDVAEGALLGKKIGVQAVSILF
jgi:membrane-associated phospholipid phosphatase